ncbi:MAG: AbrB/MazE/SpoVT family DNA-binding domain-containing protein [Bacilli bacterium]
MKNTGIVRKIDELGRIVLPKELRKSLNIATGDDFQITLDDEKIILERYSKLKNYNDELIKITNCFSSILNYKIYIVVNNKALGINDEVNSGVMKIIQERKFFVNDHEERLNILMNTIDEGKSVIQPIVIDSDLLGAIIIVGKDKIENIVNTSKIINNIIKSNILN